MCKVPYFNKLHRFIWDQYYIKHPNDAAWGANAPDEHIIDYIRFLNNPAGSSIIDIGCGHGKNAKYFVEKGFKTCGIDISETAIKYCKKQIDQAQFACADITTIYPPLILSGYDILIDAGCLHVIPKSQHLEILIKYKRLVKNCGNIFIRIFNNPKNTETPIFYVEDLPVYGYSRAAMIKLFSYFFTIENIIFENKDGPWGIFYLYMKNCLI